jgi:hypothetical protein
VVEVEEIFERVGKLVSLRQVKPLAIDRQEPPFNQRQYRRVIADRMRYVA